MSLQLILVGFVLIIVGIALMGIPMVSLVGVLMIIVGLILIGIGILGLMRGL